MHKNDWKLINQIALLLLITLLPFHLFNKGVFVSGVEMKEKLLTTTGNAMERVGDWGSQK